MKAIWVTLLTLALLGAGVFWSAVRAMCQDELRTRFDQLPRALLWLAALRVSGRAARDDLADEWAAELDSVIAGTDGLPMTRLWRGLRFSAGMLLSAPAIAREFTGSRRRRIRAAIKLAAIPYAILGCAANAAHTAELADGPGHPSAEIHFATLAAFYLLCGVSLVLLGRAARPQMLTCGLGTWALAVANLASGGWWIAAGVFFVAFGAACVLLWRVTRGMDLEVSWPLAAR